MKTILGIVTGLIIFAAMNVYMEEAQASPYEQSYADKQADREQTQSNANEQAIVQSQNDF